MITRDIYCSVNLLLKQHGNAAKAHAAKRVHELKASGDEKGAWAWVSVIDAIKVFELSEPLDGQTTQQLRQDCESSLTGTDKHGDWTRVSIQRYPSV